MFPKNRLALEEMSPGMSLAPRKTTAGKMTMMQKASYRPFRRKFFRASYMGCRQGSRQKQAAPPETMPEPSRFAQTEQEQTAEEREHEPCKPHTALFRIQSPAADIVALRVALVNEGAARQKDQDRQPSAGKLSDEHGVKDIGDVFEEEGPGRTVQRVHFRPSAHIQGNGNGQQRESHGHNQQHFPYGGFARGSGRFQNPEESKKRIPPSSIPMTTMG